MKKLLALSLITLCLMSLATAKSQEQFYTGLIVDARELGINPSKSPKIYDLAGKEIYGTLDIDPDYVIKVGIVQYENTIGDAIRHETAGVNPIVVRAAKKGEHPSKADVIISVDDGNWIRHANEKTYFLDLLKVVFVI